MNIDNTVKIEGAFDVDILRILREIPGIIITSRRPTDNADIDAVIEFAGERKRIVVQFKKRINAANAWQFVKEAETHPRTPLLVVAGRSTAESRAILRDHGVAIADNLGNVHIQLPGLLVHMEGSPRRQSSTEIQTPKISGKSGVIAQVLLIYHNKPWHVNELAEEADTSVGLTHRVLNRLEKEKVVTTEGSGPKKIRRVVDPRALLDLWVEEEKSKPTRSQGFVLAQTPRQLIEKVGVALQEAEIDHALTGAAAASLVEPFVTAVPIIELWITALAAPEDLYKLIGGEIVGEGANVSLLQEKDDTPLVFREKVEGQWISNHFRIYLDLLRDPRRGREQAMHFRSEVIGF
jgi:hypothetical protein